MSSTTELPKPPNIARYQRASKFITADRMLSRSLGPYKPVTFQQSDGTPAEFPLEIVYIVNEIHRQGLDVKDLSRSQVLAHGHHILVESKIDFKSYQPPVTAAPAKKVKAKEVKAPTNAAPEPPEPPKPQPTAIKTEASAVKKVRVAPEPSAKTEAKPEPPAEPTQPLKEKAPRAKRTEPASSAPISPSAKKGGTYLRPSIPNVPGICIMNLGHGIAVLLEPYVAAKDPEAIELHKIIVAFVDRVYSKTALPGSAEKEKPTDTSK